MRRFLWIFILMLPFFSTAGRGKPRRPPIGYQYIGKYCIKIHIRVQSGKMIEIDHSKSCYYLYKDENSCVLYKEGVEGVFQKYFVYNTDGILKKDRAGVNRVPGVQARLISEKNTKHLSITQQKMTLSTINSGRDSIDIIFAVHNMKDNDK